MTTTHPTIRTTALGPRTRREVRSVARFVDPVTLQIAGRRWMPVVGILHHRGRRSGRAYATPLGMRHLGDSFGVVTYLGKDYTLVEPEVIDYATAAPAFPRYERLQFRLIGIDEYLRLRIA